MRIDGSCHCGRITYRAEVDPDGVYLCHCSDCQVLSGAPFRAVAAVPVEQVQMQGQARHYVKVAASGNRRAQAFCADCGTQLYATEADTPRVMNIRLGCVNERAQIRPRLQVWTSSAVPWLHDLDAVPAHTRGRDSPLR